MRDDPNPRYTLIHDCEAAIGRIRAALRAGDESSPAVGTDFMFIRNAVAPLLAHYARQARRLGPEAEDEAMDEMFDLLQRNVWSLTFDSLETGFGAYLHHMPLRALAVVGRKYGVSDVSSLVARLDAENEDGLALHETVADAGSQAAFAAVERNDDLYAAIRQLPDAERQFILLHLAGAENNEIARRLGVSAPTTSRIKKRALALLKQWLSGNEE